MNEVSVSNFIVDLKVDPQGEVKILELGKLQMSGLQGLWHSYGNPKKWVQDTVYTFLEDMNLSIFKGTSLGYSPKSSVAQKFGLSPVSLKDDFDENNLTDYAGIILQNGSLNAEERAYLETELKGQVIASDQNALYVACCNNKAAFYALASDTIPELLPKQRLYAVIDGRVDAAKITEDFDGHSHVVLKQPENARANGVSIVKLEDIRSRFFMGKNPNQQKLRTQFSLKHDEVLVVQELIKGQGVKAFDDRGRAGSYDPVIRVIATAYRTNGKTHVKCHGAYYKFPPKAASNIVHRNNTVSKVQSSGPSGRALPQDKASEVFENLEGKLPKLFEKIFVGNPQKIISDLLEDDNEGKQKVGLVLATRKNYFDLWNKKKLKFRNYPKDIAQKIYALRGHSKTVQTALKSPHHGYNNSMPKELFEEIKTSAEKDNPLKPQSMWRQKLANKLSGKFHAGQIPLAMLCGIASLIVGLLYSSYSAGRATDATINPLFNEKALGNSGVSNLAYHQVKGEEQTTQSYKRHLKDIANDRELESCVRIKSLPLSFSKKFSSQIAMNNPTLPMYALHFQEEFHLYSKKCPEINMALSPASLQLSQTVKKPAISTPN